MGWKAKLRSFCCSHMEFLRVICVFGLQMFTTNMRKHVSAVKACHDLKPDLKSLIFPAQNCKLMLQLWSALWRTKRRGAAQRGRGGKSSTMRWWWGQTPAHAHVLILDRSYSLLFYTFCRSWEGTSGFTAGCVRFSRLIISSLLIWDPGEYRIITRNKICLISRKTCSRSAFPPPGQHPQRKWSQPSAT